MDYNYNKWSGVHALMVTPFHEDMTIDYAAFERYVQWQANNKPQFLFAVCGSAEMKALTPQELETIAKLAVKNANGVPVLTTGNLDDTFEEQAAYLQRMEDSGIAGFVFVTRGYGEDHEKMYSYMMELASKTTLPIALYEYPGFKPHHMKAVTYGELVKTGRFIAIKDTTCTMEGVKAKIAVQGDSSVLNANVPLLYDSYRAGGRGVMCTTSTCFAQLFVKQYDQVVKGDWDGAKQTHEIIATLDAALGDTFPCSAKYFLSLQGVPMRYEARDGKTLSESRRRALDFIYDWAKGIGAL